jgi:hypothetical protein
MYGIIKDSQVKNNYHTIKNMSQVYIYSIMQTSFMDRVIQSFLDRFHYDVEDIFATRYLTREESIQVK